MLKKFLGLLSVSLVILNQGARAGEAPGLTAFKKHIFPILENQCMVCHDGTTPKAPAHSVANPETAYRRFKPYVTFNNISASQVLKKIDAKHWEKYGGGADISVEAFHTAIKKWWDEGENQTTKWDGYFTEPISLPMLNEENYTVVQFPIPDAKEFPGILFEVEAKKTKGIESSYVIFKSPKIRFKSSAVNVKTVRFLVDGIPLLKANNWEDLDSVSYPGTQPAVLKKSAVNIPMDPKTQKISINIGRLELRDNLGDCKELEMFKRNVLTTMQLRNCAACHGGTGENISPGIAGAMAAFPMNVPTISRDEKSAEKLNSYNNAVKELCKLSLHKMLPLEDASLLKSALGENGHPKVFVGDEDAEALWMNWAQTEMGVATE